MITLMIIKLKTNKYNDNTTNNNNNSNNNLSYLPAVSKRPNVYGSPPIITVTA